MEKEKIDGRTEKRFKRYKDIMKLLKKEGRLSTGRIHGSLNIDSVYCKKLLEDMKKLNYVVEEKETVGVYWTIK